MGWQEGKDRLLISHFAKCIVGMTVRTPHGLETAHQRVYDGDTDSGIMIPAEQEVLFSQSQRSDGILYKVVINAEATVIQVTPQPGHDYPSVYRKRGRHP